MTSVLSCLAFFYVCSGDGTQDCRLINISTELSSRHLLETFICIRVLCTCLSVYHMNAWFSWRPEDGITSPGAGVTNGCERPHGARNGIKRWVSSGRSPSVLVHFV